MNERISWALPWLLACVACAACGRDPSGAPDKPQGSVEAPPSAQAAPPSAPPEAPQPAPAPEIIVEQVRISVGKETASAGETGLVDKLTAWVSGQPSIEGKTVSVVAMRNAKPSAVQSMVVALARAKAGGVAIKSDARDGTTQSLPVVFASHLADCTTVAWLGKDASIQVWPAGGGAAHRVTRGLAGPDMTLGLETMRRQWEGCSSPQIAIGADDRLTWGLVFDLGTRALHAPGARADAVVLVASAVAGKKLTIDRTLDCTRDRTRD